MPKGMAKLKSDLRLSECLDDFKLLAASGEGEKKIREFSMTAYNGGILQLYYPIVVDLSGLKVSAKSRPILRDHDSSRIVGHTKNIDVANSIKLVGFLSGANDHTREVFESADNGFPWQASICASVQKYVFVEEGESVQVNGRTFKGPIYVARQSVLKEVSFVALGADDNTSAKMVAEANEGDQEIEVYAMNFEQWLEAKGLKLADLADAVVKVLKAQWEGEQKRAEVEEKAKVTAGAGANPGTKPDDKPGTNLGGNSTAATDIQAATQKMLEENRRIIAEDLKRVTSINKLFGEKYPEVKAKAIEESWSNDKAEAEFNKAELKALRDNRPGAPAIHAGTDQPLSASIIEAAILQAGRYSKVEKEFDDKTLQAAHTQWRGRLGLKQLLYEVAAANGYRGSPFGNLLEIQRHAMGMVQASGFSTIAISGILSNVANKMMLDAFMMVEQTWRRVTAVKPVTDFKTITSYRLVGKEQYEKVGPTGELKHGTLEEESFTNKADTYGLMLSITREDMVNDDMGAITLVPRKLGRGAGLKINDVFWTAFMDNASFFASGNSNYFEGAGTVLGIDSLTTAETKFFAFKDPQNKPIGTMPAILLVPPDLSSTANALMNALEIRDTTASTKFPTFNPHAGKYRPEVSRYLNNSSYSGYSTTAWYLLADPMDMPVIETVFLNGQESPTTESADADFNVLGIQMRGYHDFGVTKQDTRGGVKSKGAA